MSSQMSKLVTHGFPAWPPSWRRGIVMPTQPWSFRKVIRTAQWDRGGQPPWGVSMKTQSFQYGAAPWPCHLGLVQCLGLGFAGLGNLLEQGADLGNDVTDVQAVVVVHGQHDRHVAGLGLELTQLLWGKLAQCPPPCGSHSPWSPRAGEGGLALCPHSIGGAVLFHTGWH